MPVRPRYRLRLKRRPASPDPESVETDLANIDPLPFLVKKRRVGEVRAALGGGSITLHARLEDRRAADWPREHEGWNGPLFGLLAAPSSAENADDVDQVVLFPHGNDGGTAWCFQGPDQGETPTDLQWKAQPDGKTAWTVSAIIPLRILGLVPDVESFRIEAMANLLIGDSDAPRLITLFGSQTARLELETLAHARATG